MSMNILFESGKFQPTLWQTEVPRGPVPLHADIPSLGKGSRAESWKGQE